MEDFPIDPSEGSDLRGFYMVSSICLRFQNSSQQRYKPWNSWLLLRELWSKTKWENENDRNPTGRMGNPSALNIPDVEDWIVYNGTQPWPEVLETDRNCMS